MLEEFRELVRAGILRVTPENEVLSTQESAGGPAEGKQPRAPASREEDVAALDKQLLEWLDRRRQQKAENAQLKPEPKSPGAPPEAIATSIREKVVARLAQKILENWERADPAADPHHSLREQVIERLAGEILRRWQQRLE
jgi:hypothetical protein